MFGYTTIENLKKEFREMIGKEVGYGYFRHTESDVEENELTISIFDVLDSLEAFEITKKEMYDNKEEEYFEYDIEEYFEKGLDEGWLVEKCSDNSYNWNSPMSHHINFEIYYNDEGSYIVRFRIHRYGDVRCNYSDWCCLEFSWEDEFLEVLMEECSKCIDVEMDGKQYYVTIEVLSDEIRLESYDEENGYEDIYGADRDTILEKMIDRELISW